MGRPIKDIKDKDLNQLVYPKTHIKAVAVDNYSNLEDYLNNSGFVTSEDAGYDVNGVQLSFATPAEAQSYADTARQAAINYSKQYTEEQISSSVNSLNSQIQNSLNSLETELTAAISDNNDVILDMVDQTITDRLGDIDVEVPTLTSQLTNDSGFITEAPSDDVIYGRKNGEWVDVNQEFEPIGTIKTSEVGNVFGDKYVACNGALLDLADYPDLVSNFPLNNSISITGLPGTISTATFCGEYFWVCAYSYSTGTYVYRSSNGFDYTQVAYLSGASYCTGVHYIKGVYVIGTYGNPFYSTDNGITWIQSSTGSGGGNGGSIAANSNIMIQAPRGDNYIQYTTDGINWTSSGVYCINKNSVEEMSAFATDNYIFAIANTNTYGKYSSDGINWTTYNFSSARNYNRVPLTCKYKNTFYFAGGSKIYSSVNETNWIGTDYSGYVGTDGQNLFLGNTVITDDYTCIGAYPASSIFVGGKGIMLVIYNNSMYAIDPTKYQVPTQANSYIKVRK